MSIHSDSEFYLKNENDLSLFTEEINQANLSDELVYHSLIHDNAIINPLNTNSSNREDFKAQSQDEYLEGFLVNACRKIHQNLGSINPICKFNDRTLEAPGFAAKREINIKSMLKAKTNRLLDHFSLGRAVPCNGLIVVGTNSPTDENYVVCTSHDDILAARRPVIGYTHVSAAIHDIQFLQHRTFLSAYGEGNISSFHIRDDGYEIIHSSEWKGIHSDCIREMSVNSSNRSVIATCGHDGRLCISDLNKQEDIIINSVLIQNQAIGSVQWISDDSSISCTTDNGDFLIFDSRLPLIKPTVSIDTEKQDLFDHAFTSSKLFICGYGDGEMRIFDLRQVGLKLDSIHDPYVEGIGILEYSASNDALVVSGYTDFTVWKNTSKGARIWSHGVLGTQQIVNQNNATTYAGFTDTNSEEIIVSGSDGDLHIFLNEFNSN